MNTGAFLKELDHARIVAAIAAAESRCRAEIRVHVSSQPISDAEKAAVAQFEALGMTATRERNGVLIYVAPASRKLAIVGDTGIHERCGAGFWRETAAAMEADFRAGRFTDGIVAGVKRAGEALATHFPPAAQRPDVNELPDEVSED
jgi:uncharacterized membrane protein